MPPTPLPRLAILGAGPIGLEAALVAATLRLPFTVYERGRIGEHLRRWGHVRLFTPFGKNTTPLGLARVRADDPTRDLPDERDCLTGRDHLAAYLEPLAASPLLRDHLRLGTEVVKVGRQGLLKDEAVGDSQRARQPFRLLLRTDKGEQVAEADIVLDCTGTYGQPCGLGDGGLPAVGERAARPAFASGLEDVLGERRGHYADRTTLVVGSGYSAATMVCALAGLAEKHPGTWVIWLSRQTRSQPLRRFVGDPLRERDQLAVRANQLATRGDGNVEYHAPAVVETIACSGPDGPFRVTGQVAGKPTTWEVDRVIANVGSAPDPELTRELQVQVCPAAEGPAALAAALREHSGDGFSLPSPGPALLRNLEPNFYFLGARSFGRNPAFFLRVGFEQVRDVFTLITGKSDLDLARKR